MDTKRYYIGFNLVRGIGPIRLRALINAFGDVERAWHAPADALRHVGLDSRSRNNLLRVRAQVDLERELEADAKARADRRLAQIVTTAEAVGVQIEKLVRFGHAADEITRVAREMRMDLIVMGSHSHRTLWEALLGNTAEKVAKSAPCPVLLVSHVSSQSLANKETT